MVRISALDAIGIAIGTCVGLRCIHAFAETMARIVAWVFVAVQP